MPFYEYKCSTCGQQFDLMQSMSEEALERCDGKTCVREDGKRRGRGKIGRILHAPAIHFKGSGFHNTDYGSNKRTTNNDTGGGSDGGSGDGGGDGGKSDKSSDSSSSSSSDSSSSGKTVGLDKA